jgi:hypothetical protein
MSNRLYDLYMKFGEDYTTPCTRYVIDILNDGATKFDAYKFFSASDQISMEMMKMLNNTLAIECYANL